MAREDEQALASILQSLPRGTFVGSVYRLVPLKYLRQWASAEGARRLGGRFNPPEKLAESICGIAGGFGLLYTATSPIACLYECQHVLRAGSDAFESACLDFLPGEVKLRVHDPEGVLGWKFFSDLAPRPGARCVTRVADGGDLPGAWVRHAAMLSRLSDCPSI